jgi:hypothetical protein
LRKSIEFRLKRKSLNRAFTPADLADLGDPKTVGKELTRLVREKKIRRIRRGIYEIPRPHPLLGDVGADTDAVIAAVARRDGIKHLLPSGARSANLLGLNTQVTALDSYGVQGRSRTAAQIGRGQVEFRQRSSKAMAMAGRASGWVSEALRDIGREHVTVEQLWTLRARLGKKEKRQLSEDLRYVPAWMRPFFQQLYQNNTSAHA